MDSFEYFDKASSLLNNEVPKFMSRFYNIFQAYPETTNFLNIDTGK
jgi:hemoglobin-like flavoprotein